MFGIKKTQIVGIEELQVECVVGVLPFERETAQTIFIDLHVSPHHSFDEMEDHIDEAIDYRVLAEIASKVAIHGQFSLIEKMASEILKELFNVFKLRWAWVRIVKPHVVPGAARAIVELKKEVTNE